MTASAEKAPKRTFVDVETGWPHWSTPEWFLDLVRKVNDIGLDPCGNAASLQTVRATIMLDGDMRWERGLDGHSAVTARGTLGDGLGNAWAPLTAPTGLAFVNPPYGRSLPLWTKKMASEAADGAEIIGLLPGRVDTVWAHQDVFATCTAYVFWRGRIQFGNPPPLVCKACGRGRIDHIDRDGEPPFCAAPPKRKTDNFWQPKERSESSTIPNLVPYWGGNLDRFVDAFGDRGELVVKRRPAGAWRTGRQLGRTLYRGEEWVATANSQEVADTIVAVMNGARP